MAKTRQMCTFGVGALFCGLDVARVQEVLRHREMTPVPLAPPEVRGLMNLRGQIVTAIDLKKRLKLPDAVDGKLPMNIVVKGNHGIISFLVDEIRDVLELSDADFSLRPLRFASTVYALGSACSDGSGCGLTRAPPCS